MCCLGFGRRAATATSIRVHVLVSAERLLQLLRLEETAWHGMRDHYATVLEMSAPDMCPSRCVSHDSHPHALAT